MIYHVHGRLGYFWFIASISGRINVHIICGSISSTMKEMGGQSGREIEKAERERDWQAKIEKQI